MIDCSPIIIRSKEKSSKERLSISLQRSKCLQFWPTFFLPPFFYFTMIRRIHTLPRSPTYSGKLSIQPHMFLFLSSLIVRKAQNLRYFAKVQNLVFFAGQASGEVAACPAGCCPAMFAGLPILCPLLPILCLHICIPTMQSLIFPSTNFSLNTSQHRHHLPGEAFCCCCC